jgi:hypothetical protein
MAIQRYAADSGYIVVSDRRHGGAEQPKTPRKARRALAAATQSASPQPFFDALPQPSIGVALSPCTLTCNLAMRWGVSTVRAVPAHAHDGSRSACGKLSVNMVNATRGDDFRPARTWWNQHRNPHVSHHLHQPSWCDRSPYREPCSIVQQSARVLVRAVASETGRTLVELFATIVACVGGGHFGGYDAEGCNQRSC